MMNIPIFIDSLQWYRDDYSQTRNKLMMMGVRQEDLSKKKFYEARKEMGDLFDLFAKNQRLDKDLALRYLEQGLQVAQSDEGHPYWELLFEYWQYTTTAPNIGDVSKAVRLFVKVSSERYRDCPIKGRIHAALIDAYVWSDPISYAQEIREAISYTVDYVPIEQNTFQRMLWAKSRLHYELQEHELVVDTASLLLNYADDYAPDQINAHLHLAQAHLALGEYEQAHTNALLAYDIADANNYTDFQRASLTVQASIHAHLQQWGSAEVVRYQMRELDWQGAKWLDLSFDAELNYWRERNNIWAKFVVVRFARQILEYYRKQEQIYWICRSRYQLIEALVAVPVWIRWLVRLALDVPSLKEQVQLAQEDATYLKRSEWYLDRLSKIAYPYMD
ncbi:MAG: hypothetical protein AAFV93_11310 [Chloroflexota bacterium]